MYAYTNIKCLYSIDVELLNNPYFLDMDADKNICRSWKAEGLIQVCLILIQFLM